MCHVRCALLHEQVRKYMKTIIKPGLPLTEMCETLESTVRKLIDERGLDAGGWCGCFTDSGW